MSGLRPVMREFRDPRSRRAHLGWKILGDVKNFHGCSIVTELEDSLVKKGTNAIGAAVSVVLPVVCKISEDTIARQPMHDPQLRDMQAMVKGAGQHGDACP